jgi:hypothetical protein
MGMKKLTVLATALMTVFALSGTPAFAAKTLSGLWLITFYAGPNRVKQPAICVRFVATNNIAGFTHFSGTWVSTTNPNLNGQWTQSGDDVQWYGADATKSISYFSVGNLQTGSELGGVSYAQFSSKSGGTFQAGNWTGDKTSRCVGGL